MERLVLMSGAPASGKTTWAKKYLAEHPEVVYISRDEVRFSILQDGDSYFDQEKRVFAKFADLARTALEAESTVLLDATHLNKYSVRKILNRLEWKEPYSIVRFEVSLDTLLSRNSERYDRTRVPESAIIGMFNSLDNPNEYCNDVLLIKED